ncbi:DUF2332 domain-containing protein [Citromicrobium bathyomarinum]|uniref:DUF2332 domain-containing protein n=1 Tax=Citromicrobium bathyomarinum TaxID=72174 RepID=UPI003159EEFC
MADKELKYETVDPQAKGFEAVQRAFANQVAYCRDNGAPVTATICQALYDLLETERGGAVMRRVRKWAGPPLADALPLRLAGGLHALHLADEDPSLSAIYLEQRVSNPAELVADAIERHEAFLMPWLDGPPQTNEAGRSWAYAAAMLWLADKGLSAKFALNEIGSSAGINLMLRRYFFDLGGVTAGPKGAQMRLVPEWRGSPPPDTEYEIVAAQGCDVKPVDLTDPAQALRLKAYIWPEFTERFARMDAAIAAADRMPPEITRETADVFVERVLAQPAEPGVTRVIMHSVVWQYVPEAQREKITEAIEKAGAAATEESPIAWISLEANRDTHRHELTVRYWAGNEGGGKEWQRLGVAHPHGTWVDWEG